MFIEFGEKIEKLHSLRCTCAESAGKWLRKKIVINILKSGQTWILAKFTSLQWRILCTIIQATTTVNCVWIFYARTNTHVFKFLFFQNALLLKFPSHSMKSQRVAKGEIICNDEISSIIVKPKPQIYFENIIQPLKLWCTSVKHDFRKEKKKKSSTKKKCRDENHWNNMRIFYFSFILPNNSWVWVFWLLDNVNILFTPWLLHIDWFVYFKILHKLFYIWMWQETKLKLNFFRKLWISIRIFFFFGYFWQKTRCLLNIHNTQFDSDSHLWWGEDTNGAKKHIFKRDSNAKLYWMVGKRCEREKLLINPVSVAFKSLSLLFPSHFPSLEAHEWDLH